MSKMDVHFSSENNNWETPDQLFQELNKKYGPFEIDVAASASNTKCVRFFDTEDDGLKSNWVVNGPTNCFLNPPYSRPENPCKRNCKKKRCEKRGHCIDKYIPGQIDFIRKAYHESSANGATVCILIPARTDTDIFHSYIWDRENECKRPWVKSLDFLPSRVKFLIDGKESDPAPFPSMVVVFNHGV